MGAERSPGRLDACYCENQRRRITDNREGPRSQQRALDASAICVRYKDLCFMRARELRAEVRKHMDLGFLLHEQQQERQDGKDDGTAHGNEVYSTPRLRQFSHTV